MKIARSFNVALGESVARERVIGYLTRAGYKLVHDERSRLTFERGSLLGTLSGFNPKSWSAKQIVTFAAQNGETVVMCLCDVNTIGHIITGTERAWWNSEVGHLEMVVKGHFAADAAAAQAEKGAHSIVRYTGLIVGAAVIVLAISLAAPNTHFDSTFIDIAGFWAVGGLAAYTLWQLAGIGKRRS